MLREQQPTAPMVVPVDGVEKLFGGKGPLGTRRKFPQVSANLSQRWCSSNLKISLGDCWLANDPQFSEGRTLVVTGERAEESRSRASYSQFELHRADNRNGRKVQRFIDHWRPVHLFKKSEVWALIRKYRVVGHPSYFLSWTRTSCRACVFGGKNQWASVRLIAPGQFHKIARYEKEFGFTIHRSKSVETLADEGTPYRMDPFWIQVANSRDFNLPIIVAEHEWILPAGASGSDQCGPT